jgi:hypothetical protein
VEAAEEPVLLLAATIQNTVHAAKGFLQMLGLSAAKANLCTTMEV